MLNVELNNNWLISQTQSSRNRVAISSSVQELSFQQLSIDVERRSNEIAHTVSKNDIIALPALHSVDFVINLLAVWNTGAAVLPLNPNLKKDELDEQIKLTGSKLLKKLKSVKAKNSAPTKFSANDNALIMFTSGSTGNPKAVVHTFKSLYTSAESIDKLFDFQPGEKWLASLPFYRIGGFQIILRALLSGGTLCIPDEVRTESISQSLSKLQPDYISLVNASLKELLKTIKSELKKCKAIFVGGGPVNSELMLEGIKDGVPLYKVYGSTETGSMVTILSPEEALSKLDSAGKSLPGVRLKIINDEILVSSESLFTGYLKNDQLTESRLNNGWFTTGDEGFIDKDGFLFVKNRKDNLLISGGEKIDPREIENELRTIEEIESAVVFGISDKKWGVKICAAVTTTQSIKIEKLRKRLKEIMPPHKIPKEIKIVDKIPVDEMGKINVSELQKLFE